MIRITVVGAAGRMGRQVCQAILDEDGLSLVGAVDVAQKGKSLQQIAGLPCKLNITDNLEECLKQSKAEVMVDFTHHTAAMNNIRTAASSKVSVVVGTTGLTEDDLKEIGELAKQNNVGAIVAPNFALGAVLMMVFAKQAAKYFKNLEIIELHHEKKIDAPSGTALKTAQDIADVYKDIKDRGEGSQSLSGVRGGKIGGVRIHSIRLPGLVAHQEVIFGHQGQTLTIRHDSSDRTSFMPGVVMAIKTVQERKGKLVYGLEKLLDL